MSSSFAKVLFAGIVGACFIFVLGGGGILRASGKGATGEPSKIAINYPVEGSIFPPEITPPTFLWRDANDLAKRWVVDVSFADHSKVVRLEVAGEFMRMGEMDPQAGNLLAELTPEQKLTRTWKPDSATWSNIKQHSVKSPATITITGFGDDGKHAVSVGTVKISTSADPVGAPIFYRDVPLMVAPPNEKGAIQPLPPSAIPLIKWQLRSIDQPKSRTVMENLPTCANCHSFSGDGKTFGMDVDGPKNDKGLYALVPVAKNMAIRNQDVIRWSSFQENADTRSSEPTQVKRFGFMSQVSPNGRYVVTSIGPPALGNSHQSELPDFVPGLADRLFSMVYNDIRFIQVFYPTRGVLAWYDKVQGKLRYLPGADDPRFVHTSAFWSPDGKYLIFSRADARDPYPEGAEKPERANDPREPQVQYDLYKIPFNDGKGGKAEPIQGASQNGMSNNFPKVSPDGRWIVFVQNHNGLLMRPDSKLYIVPFEGGTPRLMNCNTSLMNSWHTFSPNGRWLAFSSKARSPYTQLMLTHIDENGNDSPAIIVDNTTAANRAINIPEFVNIPADGIDKIDPQATEFYRLFNQAFELMEKSKAQEAVPVLRQAIERDPEDALAHYALGTALSASNQENEAVEEYRKACLLDPKRAPWFAHLAVSQALTGDMDGAVANWRKSLELDPSNAGAEADLGTALFELGRADEGYAHLRKSITMAPNFPDAHNHLGWELAKTGKLDEAIDELKRAIALRPDSMEYQANFGYVAGLRGDFNSAADAFKKAVELNEAKDWRLLSALAEACDKAGRKAEAIDSARQALDLAIQQHDQELENKLRAELDRLRKASGAKQ